MKLIIQQNSLLTGLQKSTSVSSTKQGFPALNHVLLETKKDKLKLVSTDLDTTIISVLPATITEQGRIAVPLKQFAAIVRELPSKEVSLELIKNNLLIKCELIEFKLNTLNPDEFPKIETKKELSLIKINTQEITDIIRLTSFCVGYDDTSYVLNGILFEVYNNIVTAVATDGKRLAVVRKKLPNTQSELKEKIKFILSIKTIQEVQKIIKDTQEDIFFYAEKNKVGFDIGDTQIITRPIEGDFPDYNQYIPKQQHDPLVVNRKGFLAALRRAALLTTPDYQSVKLEISKNKISISKTTPQLGEVKEAMSCVYGDKMFSIGFNPGYLIDVLKNLDGENAHIEFFGADKPAVLRESEYVYLVLPMKI